MQSIYRFRSADVGLFTRVLQQGRMGDVPVQALSLTANFRSRQEVVGWINHQFSAVFPARDERDSGAVRYHPAVAEQQGGGGVRIHALTPDETDEDEARLITAVIRESLQLPGVNEIAVLARARKHLRALAQELVRAGIDFEAVKVDELAGRPVILDLLAITRAVLHPHDRVAAAALLRAPWCGLRLPELHCVLGEQPADAIWQHIKLAQKDPQIADESRDRLTMLSRVMETTSQLRGILSLRELVEFSWLQLGGPFAYADESELENAAEFLALLDRIEQVGPSDLVQRLNEGLEALYAQARPARVRLMTIHQAKGLEFDVVILPGLHRATSKREQPLIIAQQFARDGHPGDQPPPEESGLLMAPVTQRGQDAPSIYRYLGAVDTERQAYESVRLLYVAATRAKKHLHLCGRVKFSQKSGCYAEAGSFLQMLLPAFETAFSTRDYRAGGKAPRREQQPVSLPLLRLVNAPAARLEAPEIPPADASRLMTLPDRDAVALGQALHLWLELIHDHRDRVWTSAWFAEHTGMLTSLLRRTGANPGSVASLLPRLCRMIQMALETENGRQAVSPDQTAESHAELTLFQREGNRIGQRIIDRLYRNEDGRWHIVDYKSGTSAPNPLQRWNDQLNEYAALVSEALGAELPGCRIYQAETGELVALECLMQDGSVSSDKGVVA